LKQKHRHLEAAGTGLVENFRVRNLKIWGKNGQKPNKPYLGRMLTKTIQKNKNKKRIHHQIIKKI